MTAPFFAIGLGWLMLRNPWITTVLFHGSMAAALWINRKQWQAGKLNQGWRGTWLVAAILSTALFAWWLFRRQDRFVAELLNKGADYGLAGPGIMLLAVYFCLANPLLEEAFWRGLFNASKLHPVTSDLAYGGFHYLILCPFVQWKDAVLAVTGLVGIGYCWRLLSNRLGGQAVAVVWHALGDVTVILVLFLAAYQPQATSIARFAER